jgi:two-component system, response regulator PdtaR
MTIKGRILVVDDDRLVLATVTHGLAQAGYDVIDADNGDDAILLARQHRPELALLDIRMEGKTGFDVAEYLRDVVHVPFMFLSAFADADTRAKVESLGAMAYLIKPLDVGQIVPTVDQVFARLRGAGRSVATPVQEAPPSPEASPSTTGAEAPKPDLAPVPVPIPAPAAEDPVPLALGILMHRHSLTRAQAAQRLRQLAADKGLSPAQQASRLVDAVEELASSSPAA